MLVFPDPYLQPCRRQGLRRLPRHHPEPQGPFYMSIIYIKMILWPSRTSRWCFRTPSSDHAGARDADVFLPTIMSLRDLLICSYYTSKWSSHQARLHAGVSGPLPPTSPTPGAPTSFTPPSRASGTLLYGHKYKNDPLTLFFNTFRHFWKAGTYMSTSFGSSPSSWLGLTCLPESCNFVLQLRRL